MSTLVMAMLAAAPSATLEVECRRLAARPDSAWALAHGIIGAGGDFTLPDGRLASHAIVYDFLATGPAFPPRADGGAPVEPHPHLLTKVLVVDARLPLDGGVPHPGGPVRVATLVAAARRAVLEPHPATEVPWMLEVLTATMAPGDRLRRADGTEVDVAMVFDDALALLERESARVGAGMDRGQPVVVKDGRGIHRHPCGGLHLVHAVLGWARHPAVRQRWGPRLARQVAILAYRVDSEQRQYLDALALAGRAAPELTLDVLVQMLKFHGHALEVLALAEELGLSPSRQAGSRAASALEDVVRRLEARGVFTDVDRLVRIRPRTGWDLIGDTCHAARGLRRWASVLRPPVDGGARPP